jgi:UDP-N-acetylglucosamine--N-acetylmuramyl-(pentapeptide) pyrophosphoryl-undecaprenol N-acetylglucosamine transferase
MSTPRRSPAALDRTQSPRREPGPVTEEPHMSTPQLNPWRRRAPVSPPRAPVAFLAGSPGGHLDLLRAVGPRLRGVECVWVTAPGPQAEDLARRGEQVERVPEYGRSPWRVIPNLRRAVEILRRRRPELVIASGSSAVVPISLLARLFGARVLFVETTARVGDASISGRVISRVASAVLVQWAETCRKYPRSVLCRPALWEQIRTPSGDGEGTFVALGTRHEPFDRLLAVVDEAVEAGILPGPVVAQSGHTTYRPRTFEPVAWLEPAQVEEAAGRARYVVCHSGSGIIGAALRNGKRPLVLPRLHSHGEHVDDHQLQIAHKLEHMGLAVALGDHIAPGHLAAALSPLPASAASSAPAVAEVLQATIEDLNPAIAALVADEDARAREDALAATQPERMAEVA